MAGEAKTFVDTNVLVYAHDASETVKQPIARAALDALWIDASGVISTQVLQEFYSAARRLARPISRAEAREIIGLYSAWPVVVLDPTLILAATRLEEKRQVSFWDALIVEAARIACSARTSSMDRSSTGCGS